MNNQTTRPSRNDPALQAIAAEQLAQDCAIWDMAEDPTPSCIEGWRQALMQCRLSGNGYDIARDLEDHHSVSPDEELVEILGSASSCIWMAHDTLVKAWVQQNNIIAPLSVGQAISCRYGKGLITRLDKASARYIFQPYGDEEKYAGGGGIFVEYEAAQGIEARSGETGTGSTVGESPVREDAPHAS